MKNPHDERAVRSRRRILDATQHVLIDEGVDSVTIHAVAEAAGVQRSTVYNHWPDRLVLIVDAIEDYALGPREDRVEDTTPVESALAGLRTLVIGLGRSLRGDWGAIASSLAAAAEHDAALAEAHAAFVQGRRSDVDRLLQAAVDAGELRPDLDVAWATSLLVGPPYYERLVMHRAMTDAELTDHLDRTLALLGAATRPQDSPADVQFGAAD